MEILRTLFADPATRPFAIGVVSIDALILAYLIYRLVKWRRKEGYRAFMKAVYQEYERVKKNHEKLLPQLRAYAVSTTPLKFTTGVAEDLQEVWRETDEFFKEIDEELERRPRRLISRFFAWLMEDGNLSERYMDYPPLTEEQMESIRRRLNAISATHEKLAGRLKVAITPRKMGRGDKLETLDEFHNRMARGKEAAKRREREFEEAIAKLDDAFDYVVKRHSQESLEWEPPMTWRVPGLEARHLFNFYHHHRRLAHHLRKKGEKADTTAEKETSHREVISLISNAAENLKIHFEQQAKDINNAWSQLEDLKERFSELEEEMQTSLGLSQELKEAERLLEEHAPEMWREADAASLDGLLGSVTVRFNAARDRLDKLFDWKENILARGRLITRLEETRRKLEEDYEIPLKEVVGWDQAKYLFDEEVPAMWANLNIEGLNKAMDTLQRAINRQITVLSNAARGEIKLREDSGESGRSLDELRSIWNKLESLPKEATTPSTEPQRQPSSQGSWGRPKVKLSEGARTTKLGTRYDPKLASRMGELDDQEEEDDEDEPQRPSTLDAIKESQERWAQRMRNQQNGGG